MKQSPISLFATLFTFYYDLFLDRAQQAECERAMQQCYFLMQQALDADEANLKDNALKLYTQAVELAVSVVSVIFVRFVEHISLKIFIFFDYCGKKYKTFLNTANYLSNNQKYYLFTIDYVIFF